MELKIEHLSKRFKDKTAVDDVSLTLTSGVWGFIDSWLAERLKRAGEVIIEEYGCCWWGRLASGQSICMDSVIRKIAGE